MLAVEMGCTVIYCSIQTAQWGWSPQRQEEM